MLKIKLERKTDRQTHTSIYATLLYTSPDNKSCNSLQTNTYNPPLLPFIRDDDFTTTSAINGSMHMNQPIRMVVCFCLNLFVVGLFFENQ